MRTSAPRSAWIFHAFALEKDPVVPEHLSAQVHLYDLLLVIPGWIQVRDYQWGYPELGVSPALEEAEPPRCVSLLGLCQCIGLHLLWAFPSCDVPSSMGFQCHLEASCRTPV